MKKKYRAMRAIVLTTAFISIQGMSILASPLRNIDYSYDGQDIHTNSNASHNNSNNNNSNNENEKANIYGEWVIVKEPTLLEDGLRKREVITGKGKAYIEFEVIPKLLPLPSPVPPKPDPPKKEPETAPLKPTTPSPAPSQKETEAALPKPSKPALVPEKKEETLAAQTQKPAPLPSQPSQTVEDSNNKDKQPETNRHHRSHSGSKKKRSIEKVNDENKNETTDESKASQEETKASRSEGITESAVSGDKTAETKAGGSKVGKIVKDTPANHYKVSGNVVSENKAREILPSNENAVQDQTENQTVTEDKIEVSVNKTDKDNLSKKVGNTVSLNKQEKGKSADKSFNGYDGVTLLAASAYTWWIAIVLLPMVDAFKWINKKRREKSRGNVNKKHS
ncbi:hypothetical protein [Lachnoanaerobaculum saburreum]|uniref:Uncharacterized protein n=1 Tax=Lachnoanaerobaculum saburreum DSM 3986 TaxID=887325 RepID=E6LR18_9FIRM|nr:hypothetical protein [Lachnoanaerobaculum saburreum]EFU75714.1 hypothetical protein HMPREF0381_2403 [Lachnoanaerobaculum saburreum DSM 3986]